MVRCWLLLAVFLCASCGGDNSPTAPSPPPPPPPAPIPACQANNTGTLTFRNQSATVTYDAFLNNVRVGTIAPGQNSAPQNVSAGVAQHMVWRVTNTSTTACTADPIVPRCEAQTIYCQC
jgi:hypothetical protein